MMDEESQAGMHGAYRPGKNDMYSDVYCQAGQQPHGFLLAKIWPFPIVTFILYASLRCASPRAACLSRSLQYLIYFL
jgi:hypothetical protein